jgi:HTH-type transcriptional regulator/antitoxin HigA
MTVALKQIETQLETQYQAFRNAAKDVLDIDTEEKYELALQVLEKLLDKAEDSPDDSINGLIELLSRAIESYESKQEDIISFEAEVSEIPADVAMLQVLMSQYELNGSDFEDEIGDKTLVSRILSGNRNLTKNHIEKLSKRFGINPTLFFDT